jgi:hypothetical protein
MFWVNSGGHAFFKESDARSLRGGGGDLYILENWPMNSTSLHKVN